jgi:hypothetical protein
MAKMWGSNGAFLEKLDRGSETAATEDVDGNVDVITTLIASDATESRGGRLDWASTAKKTPGIYLTRTIQRKAEE